MNFSFFENLKKNSIILKRNKEEELDLKYTKIYDLTQLNKIEDMTMEEKTNILITIKKILLSTNDYISASNVIEITRYILMSTLIFIVFIIIYTPIYKNFILPEKMVDSLNESSFFQKLYCYFFFEILELIFRIILNEMKTKKVFKIMKYYAKTIIMRNEQNFILYLEDNNFDLYILRKSIFKNTFNMNSQESKPFISGVKNEFYQYVINYPNVRYYKWDKRILNEKEGEIVDDIVQTIKLAEKEHVKKFGFSVIVFWIIYFLSFNNLIKGEKMKSLGYRFIIFAFTKIVSYFMSYSFKNNLMEKEEMLSKRYLQHGYFIVLSFSVIQIFKLSDEYVDKSLNINEIYKYIHKDVFDLNEKILEK